jgi:hypothetical protein
MRRVAGRASPAGVPLRAYFDQIYFDNPWHDPEVPSHVYEDGQGRILGFIGAMQRPMSFRGRPIRAAVLCGIMVDKIDGSREIAQQLMARFLAGPQDFSMTDCAKPAANRLWEACGGLPALMYCLDWRRVLQPARQALGLVAGRKPLGALANAVWPLTWALDAAATRLPFGPYRLRTKGAAGEEASAETLLACISEFSRPKALAPHYDAQTLGWLLAESAKGLGKVALHKIIVRGADGQIAGWYMHAVRAGVAEVFQVGGSRDKIRLVLDHLFDHARRHGAVAVSGQIVPDLMWEMSESRCRYRSLSLGMLVHSPNPELTNAVFRGDAFLTRTEGEWWIRFPTFA